MMDWYQGSRSPAERPSQIQSRDNAQDDFAMPGFGIEFEYSLKRAWEDHQRRQRLRLARYSRFGMTEEDAMRATPEHMREAYRTLIEEQLADDYTPSPSPSPSPSIPPTPGSMTFDDANIAGADSAKRSLQESPEEDQSSPIMECRGASYQNIEQHSTPDSAILQPMKTDARINGTRRKVVVGSRIEKRSRKSGRIRVRNASRSRHHMETRSRKRARKNTFG